eukprot:scaffold102149_cov35-Tisochrysis_lutea.AAC.3
MRVRSSACVFTHKSGLRGHTTWVGVEGALRVVGRTVELLPAARPANAVERALVFVAGERRRRQPGQLSREWEQRLSCLRCARHTSHEQDAQPARSVGTQNLLVNVNIHALRGPTQRCPVYADHSRRRGGGHPLD